MKRVVPYLLLFLCIGIYVGACCVDVKNIGCIIILIIIAGFLCAVTTKRLFTALFPFVTLIGICLVMGRITFDIPEITQAAENRENIVFTGEVSSFVMDGKDYVYRIKVDRLALKNGNEFATPCCVRLVTPNKYACGDELYIKARFYIHNESYNVSDFNSKQYMKIYGYDYSIYCNNDYYDYTIYVLKNNEKTEYLIKNKVYAVRDDITQVFNSLFNSKQSALLNAIILGDKSSIDNQIADNFRNTGIYHFLAISGLHLSVISGFLLKVLSKLNKNFANISVCAFVVLYMIMTGASVSVTRAMLMMFILISGKILWQKYDLINSASLACIILLFYNPLYLFDIGFLYSFGAVFGIAITVEPIQRLKKFRKTATAVGASVGATAFPRLITLFNFYTINPFEIVINILLIPFMSFILIYAFIIGFGGLVSIRFAEVFSKPLGLLIDILLYISDKLSFCSLVVGYPDKTIMALILISSLFYMLLVFKPTMLRFSALILLVMLVFACDTNIQSNNISVNFLYVGQGDSCVINKGKNAYIIDCGGTATSHIGDDTGKYKVMPFLNYSGIKTVKAVFVSHSDTDHIKGLYDLMGNVKIERIYLSEFIEKNDNYFMLLRLAARHKVPIEFVSGGEVLIFDDLSFKCLFPYNKEVKENDNSMVLRLEHKNNSFLFTGDITENAENMLLENRDIKADVLKVAHHGSKTSSTKEFIGLVRPDFAVVSAGDNNSFNHPSKQVCQLFKACKIPLYITYDGMISVESDGENLTVYRKKNLEYN